MNNEALIVLRFHIDPTDYNVDKNDPEAIRELIKAILDGRADWPRLDEEPSQYVDITVNV